VSTRKFLERGTNARRRRYPRQKALYGTRSDLKEKLLKGRNWKNPRKKSEAPDVCRGVSDDHPVYVLFHTSRLTGSSRGGKGNRKKPEEGPLSKRDASENPAEKKLEYHLFDNGAGSARQTTKEKTRKVREAAVGAKEGNQKARR